MTEMANYLYDGVFGTFANDPKIFLRTPSGQISYAEFTALTNRLANCLTGAGVGPGDRVAVQAENR
jgi:malonyl-CoA/methylmalonyl-CoA synthetase